MSSLSVIDPAISTLIDQETLRQRDTIRLIASENYVSQAVLEATGSVLTNKYSEGYAGRRYYEGQENIDAIERIAQNRATALFKADHANVQSYSGSPANLAVFLAFLKPGDTVMGLSLPAGGHLTHGWHVSITGKFFRSVSYGVRKEDGYIDYDEVRSLAKKEKPKLLIAGGTAISRIIDFSIFADIANEIGAIFHADIAHIAGLVAAGVHPSPVPYADVVTSTTHKTLRGPRGGIILCKEEHKSALDRAVFPGLQGGPHNHTTAAIAVALHEASQPQFVTYAKNIVKNSQTLAQRLIEQGFSLVSGGTDNHLILCDLTPQHVSGKIAAQALNNAGIVANCNSIPFDPRKPFDPSGLRIGTAAVTSRNMKEPQMIQIATWIHQIISDPTNESLQNNIRNQVKELCVNFPAPGILIADH